jgi:hypothetical protein
MRDVLRGFLASQAYGSFARCSRGNGVFFLEQSFIFSSECPAVGSCIRSRSVACALRISVNVISIDSLEAGWNTSL